MTSVGRSLREAGDRISITRAAKKNASISRLKALAIFGRKTFTATSAPSALSFALCTWAIEAAATGSEKLEKMESNGACNSEITVLIASSLENGGIRSCKTLSSFDNELPTMSGLVESN